MSQDTAPVRIPDLIRKKTLGQKITMLTAYDASMARALDEAGVDALLVGDSLGNVIMGCETTIPVTLDIMTHHTRAVVNGTRRALVVADMPFLTYQVNAGEAVRNAGRLIQKGGAAAVKLEGGSPVAPTVRRIVDAGIPVMGHIGLIPQSVHRLGGYRTVGSTSEEAQALFDDAAALEKAGVFSIVLECVPPDTAAAITAAVAVPTIGIGAGPHCDGQVLVSYDAFGLTRGRVPGFVRRYAKLGEQMTEAARQYIADVEHGRFPASRQSAGAAAGQKVE